MPCVFLGYPFARKSYKLYNLTSKSYFVSRDVIFHEYIFPFVLPYSFYTHVSVFFLPHVLDDPVVPPTSYFAPVPSSVFLSPYSFPDLRIASSPSPDVPIALPPSFVPEVPVRTSSKPHNPLGYLKDYVCTLFSSCSTSISNIVSTSVPPVFETYTFSHATSIIEVVRGNDE